MRAVLTLLEMHVLLEHGPAGWWAHDALARGPWPWRLASHTLDGSVSCGRVAALHSNHGAADKGWPARKGKPFRLLVVHLTTVSRVFVFGRPHISQNFTRQRSQA